ncbi:hypothetical protein [Actinomadura sediminis]|uniref:Uncharacterized protein n=1 Tax=Actinomadura sediminis TaxID=1038904 RepID=A0ABW3EQ44_9ACTN
MDGASRFATACNASAAARSCSTAGLIPLDDEGARAFARRYLVPILR